MNDIATALYTSQTIAIVGLSDKPWRDSHAIAQVLKKSGYKIIPVNPNIPEVLGEKSYPDVLTIPVHIDIVNIFRNPAKVPPVIDEALRTTAHTIWLQTGITVSDEIARKVHNAGKRLVQDRCIAVAVRTFL